MANKNKSQKIDSAEIRNEILKIDGEKDKAISLILYETGCEIKELTKLKVNDINFSKEITEYNTIIFLSNKKTRKSAISSESAKLLEHIISKKSRSDKNYIFSQQPNKEASPKRIEQIVKNNLGISAKELRYMHIIHAASKGLNILTISEQTGLKAQRIWQILEKNNISNMQSYSAFFEDNNQR